jgi:hypothetical protein
MPSSLRHGSILFLQIASLCAISTTAVAQKPRSPEMPSPPPMRFVSRDERSQITAESNPKSRLKETMTLAEDHLARAEALTTGGKFDAASAEVGCYLGLMDNLRKFLNAMDPNKGSTRDLFRHFEIAVRAHLPRFAVMRRTTPVAYALHLKDAEEYIKDARSAALDSFYGQSVLRESPKTAAPIQPDPPETTKRP